MPPSSERGASSEEMVRSRIAEIYASESRRILATLTRLLGDLDQAEEAMQDAFEVALSRWPIDGIPASPRAWLVSTGRFKGIDALRRRTRGHDLAHAAASAGPLHEEPEEWDGDVIKDDELRLIFACCHPDLPVEGRIALALRVVCGLETDEVARAFLISPGAMKRRITRAKARIREVRIPYEIPGSDTLGDRLASVLRVIYLVYNEGHAATRGTEHSRRDVALAAVRLARRLDDLLSHPEVTGLLALLLFHESRAQTRTDSDGNPIPLESQDRERWDAELIGEATSLVQRGVMSGRLGPYLLQALVASVHAWASSVEETNWDLVVRYYDLLASVEPSPVVALNRAIAIGMRDGPDAGLAGVEDVLALPGMQAYHPAHGARAEFARRAGRTEDARASLERALSLARQGPERRYLQRRLSELQGDDSHR